MLKNSWVIWLFIFTSCGIGSRKSNYFVYQGYGAGYPITIEYENRAGDLSSEIKKLIAEVEYAAWLGDSNSIVSKLNIRDSGEVQTNIHSTELLKYSNFYFDETKGILDPTIQPLLNYWQHDLSKFKLPGETDSSLIDSLKRFSGLRKFIIDSKQFIHSPKHANLNFNQILPGYLVDVLVGLLNSYSLSNYRVEVMGCVFAMGNDNLGKPWLIGLDMPSDKTEERKLYALAKLNNKAFSSAGSFRDYYKKGDTRFPFRVDPISGYPVKHSLIQVMVFAPTAMEANMYSNAFMVMGMDLAKIYLQSHKEIQAYFIHANYKGEWITELTPQLREQVELMKLENPI